MKSHPGNINNLTPTEINLSHHPIKSTENTPISIHIKKTPPAKPRKRASPNQHNNKTKYTQAHHRPPPISMHVITNSSDNISHKYPTVLQPHFQAPQPGLTYWLGLAKCEEISVLSIACLQNR
eukprot:2451302-Ditylum_brightwellii.AAC.1